MFEVGALKTHWGLLCSVCGFRKLDLPEDTQWQARKKAVENGWLIDKQKMVCPGCRKKIA